MTLGIARPVMSPASMPALRPVDPRNGGEDPARIRATIARAPLFAALPISAIEDLTSRVTVRKVPVGSAVVAQDEPGDAMSASLPGGGGGGARGDGRAGGGDVRDHGGAGEGGDLRGERP